MKLTLCGTAAGPFTAQRASSGYVLESNGRCVMLDCGPGSVRGALAAGIDLRQIEAVIISHVHEDHCLDLGAFALQAMYGRFERLPLLLGPPGIQEIGAHLLRVYRETANLPPLEITEIDDPDEREVCGFMVLSRETPHAQGLHAFSRRFSDGRASMVFSGDTRPNPELMTDLAHETDLLLHECYSRPGLERYAALGSADRRERLLDRLPNTHSDVREVAKIARDASVKRLVLTHILPTEEDAEIAKEASEFYDGELTVARDGMVFEF